MAQLVLTFVRERETKNTVRFQEKDEEGEEPAIGTLYVQKQALKAMDAANAETLTVMLGTA